jgi:hypothetical protein
VRLERREFLFFSPSSCFDVDSFGTPFCNVGGELKSGAAKFFRVENCGIRLIFCWGGLVSYDRESLGSLLMKVDRLCQCVT